MLTMDDFVIRGFNCNHLTSRDISGRACGGVSVLVRDDIPYNECTLNTSLQAKAVTISTSKTITICSLYLPPSENLNIVLLTCLIVQLPTPIVACGDFNGHSITWRGDKNKLTILLKTTMYVYLMMVLIHIFTQPQEHSQPLILWRLIFWLNRIHMVVIISYYFKNGCFVS